MSHHSADPPGFHVSRVAFAESPFAVCMLRTTILALIPAVVVLLIEFSLQTKLFMPCFAFNIVWLRFDICSLLVIVGVVVIPVVIIVIVVVVMHMVVVPMVAVTVPPIPLVP